MEKSDSNRSFLSRILDYGSRDIGSFFDRKQTGSPEVPPLPLLLAPEKIDQLTFRRSILDWRDEAICHLHATGAAAIERFSKHIERRLEEVSVIRSLWAEPSNEVLLADFDKRVRSVITIEAGGCKTKLNELLSARRKENIGMVHFFDERRDVELSCILGVGFKSSNKEEINAALAELVLGKTGIVNSFQEQFIITADKTLLGMSK